MDKQIFMQNDDLGVCPRCGERLLRLWGEGWDWDKAVCSARGCDYERELDDMTCTEPDGRVYQIHKPKDDE